MDHRKHSIQSQWSLLPNFRQSTWFRYFKKIVFYPSIIDSRKYLLVFEDDPKTKKIKEITPSNLRYLKNRKQKEIIKKYSFQINKSNCMNELNFLWANLEINFNLN
jgi:hypothetical protein